MNFKYTKKLLKELAIVDVYDAIYSSIANFMTYEHWLRYARNGEYINDKASKRNLKELNFYANQIKLALRELKNRGEW